MPSVTRQHNESDESLLRRFRKQVTRAGTMTVVRNKRWHVSKSELRRLKKKKAARRSSRHQSDE